MKYTIRFGMVCSAIVGLVLFACSDSPMEPAEPAEVEVGVAGFYTPHACHPKNMTLEPLA